MSRSALMHCVLLAAATVLFSGRLSAQPPTSLEEDYAKLCANRPEPASETCVALKKALIAKLSGNSGSNAPAPTVVPAAQPATRDPVEQAKREANRLRFGVYADMVGKSFFGTNGGNYPYVAEVSWEWPDEAIVVTMYGATATGEIQESAECPPTKWFFRFKASTNQVTRTIAKPCWPQQPAAEVRIQADGAVFQTEIKGKYRDYMARKADGNYKWVRQERKGDTWVPVKYAWSTLYERTPQFLASLREEQRRLAASRRSEEGNSGLAGAMAMGLGAALAGGNAEQVMGMAMKGAELTTDNEMSRNVLAGQGDAMVAAGTQRRTAEASPSSGQPSNSEMGIATPSVSPTAPLGQTISTGSPQGSNAETVHLYCYSWSEAASGQRTSYVSNVGSVPKTASNPEIEAQTVRRWQDFLRTQGIALPGPTGCRLDTDFHYNSGLRDSYISTALSEGTLRELTWAP